MVERKQCLSTFNKLGNCNMVKIKSIFYAILIALILGLLPQCLGIWLSPFLGLPWELLGDSFCALFILGYFSVFEKRQYLKFNRPKKPWIIAILIPMAVINFLQGPFIEFSSQFLLITISCALLTGFGEEIVFRGIIQDTLETLGPCRSVIVTTLIFSLCHLPAGVGAVIIAFCFGLMFSIVRVYTNQIWPNAIIHSIVYLSEKLHQMTWEHYGLVASLLMGLYLIVGLIMTRRLEHVNNGFHRESLMRRRLFLKPGVQI